MVEHRAEGAQTIVAKFKIDTALGKMFQIGDSVNVDGIPYVVKSINALQGMYLEYEVPGLTNDHASPVIVEEWLPWERILKVEQTD